MLSLKHLLNQWTCLGILATLCSVPCAQCKYLAIINFTSFFAVIPPIVASTSLRHFQITWHYVLNHLVLRDNPLTFEVIHLYKYFQNFIKLIGTDIAINSIFHVKPA